MESTDQFKEEIKTYLDKRSAGDPLFAVKYANENKNIDDCCTYIINEVKKSNKFAFAHGEIFSMAVHYYDEENIEVGKQTNNVRVVVTRDEVPEEKREKAKPRRGDKKPKPQRPEDDKVVELSLFD